MTERWSSKNKSNRQSHCCKTGQRMTAESLYRSHQGHYMCRNLSWWQRHVENLEGFQGQDLTYKKTAVCLKWTAVYTYHFTITHLVFISYVHSSSVAFSMVAAIERSVVTVQFCICPVYHAIYWIQVERNLWTIVGTLEEMYSWSWKALFCSRTGVLWRYRMVQHCSKTTWEQQ